VADPGQARRLLGERGLEVVAIEPSGEVAAIARQRLR